MGNGITSIFLQDGDSYQWKTSMNNTFLSLDTDTGNMKFEPSGSRFRFTAPPIVWVTTNCVFQCCVKLIGVEVSVV